LGAVTIQDRHAAQLGIRLPQSPGWYAPGAQCCLCKTPVLSRVCRPIKWPPDAGALFVTVRMSWNFFRATKAVEHVEISSPGTAEYNIIAFVFETF